MVAVWTWLKGKLNVESRHFGGSRQEGPPPHGGVLHGNRRDAKVKLGPKEWFSQKARIKRRRPARRVIGALLMSFPLNSKGHQPILRGARSLPFVFDPLLNTWLCWNGQGNRKAGWWRFSLFQDALKFRIPNRLHSLGMDRPGLKPKNLRPGMAGNRQA